VKMQEKVRQHHDDSITPISGRGMPKNALPNL
jgi:hypothetical protein